MNARKGLDPQALQWLTKKSLIAMACCSASCCFYCVFAGFLEGRSVGTSSASPCMLDALGLNNGWLAWRGAGPGLRRVLPVGAYTWAMLASKPPTCICRSCAVAAGAFPAALAGLMLGAPVEVGGDYPAIVTLGFGEIVRILMNNFDKVPGYRGQMDVQHHQMAQCGITGIDGIQFFLQCEQGN